MFKKLTLSLILVTLLTLVSCQCTKEKQPKEKQPNEPRAYPTYSASINVKNYETDNKIPLN